MRQIPITALTPGMVTAEDIVSYDHVTIVPKGIILTENIISRLEGYSIYYAYIEDDLATDLSSPMTNTAALAQDADTAKSRLFQRFSQNFARCAEHYENSLMKSLYRSEPFRANELLKETMSLLRQDKQDVSIFDMLLNMHNAEDSVCNHCIDQEDSMKGLMTVASLIVDFKNNTAYVCKGNPCKGEYYPYAL